MYISNILAFIVTNKMYTCPAEKIADNLID